MSSFESSASVDVPHYLRYFSPSLLRELDARAVSVSEVEGLRVDSSLVGKYPALHSAEALAFACRLYERVKGDLNAVLEQRLLDRAFIDGETLRLVAQRGTGGDAVEAPTVIGLRDAKGRVVVGPHPPEVDAPRGTPRPPPDPPFEVQVPPFLQGEQVTLFGPPDSAKMCINAMNAWHRRLPNEPAIVTRLVEESGQVPRWGADNEDSKTPLIEDYLQACENLIGCFNGTLEYTDPKTGRHYALQGERRALPIKRIPGIAIPDGSHLYRGNPLPLHLVDFALHLFHNWHLPEALVFYVPKLENEEEAGYLRRLIEVAEELIQARHSEYQLGTVRVFLVFENPRAIFRIREMARTLWPYFVGGSLGWHDFLASTARLFKHEPSYRIPVKADPNIVINHIKESHLILARSLDPIGGLTIGGMYGVLYEEGNATSFEVSMVGYIKDVVTQLKRGLQGFWVAHPDFVRVGIALVQAYRRYRANRDDASLINLVKALVTDPVEQRPLLDFVLGDDVPGLSASDPRYLRAVLASNLEVSSVMANDDPEEVRYNVFQALQYLADWLCGNGCVALPATMKTARGEPVFVRVMDDLATTERSRWEVWAEVHHGRVSLETFEKILDEEVAFIRAGQDTPHKRVQVRWQGEAARWYPVAVRLVRLLMTAPEPVETATELLMPFTLPHVRQAEDPWSVVAASAPERYLI